MQFYTPISYPRTSQGNDNYKKAAFILAIITSTIQLFVIPFELIIIGLSLFVGKFWMLHITLLFILSTGSKIASIVITFKLINGQWSDTKFYKWIILGTGVFNALAVLYISYGCIAHLKQWWMVFIHVYSLHLLALALMLIMSLLYFISLQKKHMGNYFVMMPSPPQNLYYPQSPFYINR